MKSTFPIGWIFAIIAALALGVIKFFGSNFQHIGENPIVGVLWGLLLVVVLLGIVFLLTKFKKVSIPYKFKSAATYELLLLVFFICGLVVTILLNNHFFDVMSKQETIQIEVESQVDQMSEMFTDYQKHVDDRLNAHEAYLREVYRNRHSNPSQYVSEGLQQYSIEDLLIVLQSEIACDEAMRDDINNWTNDVLNKTSGLGMLALMPRIKEINEKLENTRDALKDKDRISEKGLNGSHWDYPLTVSKDILRHFKKSDAESINIWSVLITILLGLVILLPYLSADRDGRNKGLFWELTNQRQNAGSGTIGGI